MTAQDGRQDNPIADYIFNGGGEVAQLKASLAHTAGALEREISICQETTAELDAAKQRIAELASTRNTAYAIAQAISQLKPETDDAAD